MNISLLFNGSIVGICLFSVVFFPIFFIVWMISRKVTPTVQFKQTPLSFLGMGCVGLMFTFAAVWGTYYTLSGKGLALTIPYVVAIGIAFVPLWLASTFGTGTIEKDRPEEEQLRERRDVAIAAIAGNVLGAIVGWFYFSSGA